MRAALHIFRALHAPCDKILEWYHEKFARARVHTYLRGVPEQQSRAVRHDAQQYPFSETLSLSLNLLLSVQKKCEKRARVSGNEDGDQHSLRCSSLDKDLVLRTLSSVPQLSRNVRFQH